MLSAIRKSVRYKVMGAILAATLAALLVATAALVTYELRTYRNFLVRDVTTQAGILARMSAPALAFEDPEAAEANLLLLDNRRDILSAAIYTPRGELFATYERAQADAAFPALGSTGEPRIGSERLTLFYPIVEDGNVLGTVYLQARYEVRDRLQDLLLILGGVLLVSLIVAGVVSLPLQHGVTGPVLSVADVARRIIDQRDFTLRARKTTEDEIGVLVDAFNGMLAEVGDRQRALEASNRKLRQETEERRNAEGALRAADRRKDEFLATLAHELRNPLAPMVNALHLLNSAQTKPAVAQRAREIMERQLAHMVRLVEDLLDVSRITRGKLALRMEHVELGTIVRSAVDTVRPLIDARRQRLIVELPERPVHLQADPVRVSQVISNLLNNATKYTPEGGRIRVTASSTDEAARVTIEDDGVGIEPEQLHQMFEMFAQGGEGQDQMQTGLGVGLALAKRLVELHGGEIEASSHGSGRGSAFTVTLPIALSEAAAPEALEPCRADTGTRHRILLVDDDIDFAASLKLLLENLGHEVGIAHEASEALAAARELEPHFAFVDIGLPVVNGYELARQLRAQSKDVVLVALSGWGQDQDRRRADEAGFAMHLVKPVRLERVREALGALAPAV